jgi:hypothetical protein
MEEKVFNKYLVSLTKIVSIYCFFYVFLKILVMIRGTWIIPNIILLIPFLLLGIATAYIAFFKKYNWLIAIFGALLIVVVRYHEVDLVYYLQENYGSK